MHVDLVDQYANAGMTAEDVPDTTHPTAAGYTKMADVWIPAVLRCTR
jgi:lysophospholipase L1-like esterase